MALIELKCTFVHSSGVASSALCAYRLDEMEFSFENNPFKAQVHGDVQNLWLTVRKRESEIQNRKTVSFSENCNLIYWYTHKNSY